MMDKKNRPNIVLIVTDNQSPWTMGCYGNDEIQTPHLDRLAQRGMRFDNAFCVNPVCSPNRATLFTGLLPSQHGVHDWLGEEQPDAQMGEHAYNTIAEFDNLSDRLKALGYRCGLSGKWHLGDSLHQQHGFDYWFTIPRGHTKTFYDSETIWQGKVANEPRYILDVIGEHAIDFINQPRGESPFFLYMGINAPYGLDQDMYDGHRNQFTDLYADKPMNCFPRHELHPWQYHHREAVGNITCMRSYATAMTGMDHLVGSVLNQIEASGEAENTIVIFTADHGWHGGHNNFWGMADHSRPNPMFQTNLRVPLIVSHPGSLPTGVTCGQTVSHYDLFPTLCEYLEIDQPNIENTPGSSYLDLLKQQPTAEHSDEIICEYNQNRVFIDGDWKIVLRNDDGPNELYHLKSDPMEEVNLFDDAAHADAKSRMVNLLHERFDAYADLQYDLWREGTSKAV